MSTSFICRTCQLALDFPAGASVLECPACGTVNARPRSRGDALEQFIRATRQRLACDFRNAENSYQHVLLNNPDEHEALWGLALCRYSVEYIRDPATGKHLPLVHSTRDLPLQEDPDFQQACEFAPEAVRTQYIAEAEYIDNAMDRIRELAATCPDYDIFLCHKSTRIGSKEKSEDYTRAFQLYHLLEKAGYRVFFAPEKLRSIAGADYEAGIYHALETARVMLVVCSDTKNLASPWVQSEWKRYLARMPRDGSKRLIPLLYGEMTPDELPGEFRHRRLECLRMGELGAEQELLEAVQNVLRRPGQDAPIHNTPVLPKRPERTPPVPPSGIEPVIYAPAGDFDIRELPDGCAITRYKGSAAQVRVPQTLRGRTVRIVDAWAFYQCISLFHLILPRTVTTIARGAFCGCSNLTRVDLPECLHSIGSWAFSGCDLLEEIELPDSLTSLGEGAFDRCASLKQLYLPEGMQTMQLSPFYGCDALTLLVHQSSRCERYVMELGVSFTLLAATGHSPSTKGIEAELARSWGDFTPPVKFKFSKRPDGLLTITGYTGKDASVHIPAIINGMGVAAIGNHAFANKTALVSVTIPDSVSELGSEAFRGCTSLSSVTIPNSVVSIGDSAFHGCTSLTGITIPDSVTFIGNGAFHDCTGLTAIAIPDNVTFIGNFVFYNCQRLVSVTIPEGMSYIPSDTFRGCCNLSGVTIPKSATIIGQSAFLGCTSLTGITIPGNTTAIGGFAFFGCQNLSSIDIPDSVNIIGESAFSGCTSLTAVSLPIGLTAIGSQTFYGCQRLTGIDIPDSVTIIGESAFSGCTSLAAVTLPRSLTAIGSQAFCGCPSLTGIDIPDSVTAIGESAFSGCTSLAAVTLPRSVKTIGNGAFRGCRLVASQRLKILFCKKK